MLGQIDRGGEENDFNWIRSQKRMISRDISKYNSWKLNRNQSKQIPVFPNNYLIG